MPIARDHAGTGHDLHGIRDIQRLHARELSRLWRKAYQKENTPTLVLCAMVRCWLDIDIGDEQAHAIEAAAFERTQRCFEEIKAQVG